MAEDLESSDNDPKYEDIVPCKSCILFLGNLQSLKVTINSHCLNLCYISSPYRIQLRSHIIDIVHFKYKWPVAFCELKHIF